VLAELAEVAANLGAVGAALVVALLPLNASDDLRPSLALATALAFAAIGWLTADIRRYRGTPRPLPLALLRGGCWPPATIPLALSAVAAVALGTASELATAIALLAVAAGLLASGRPLGTAVAAAAVPWAVLTSLTHPAGGRLVGLAGAVILAVGAIGRARIDDLDPAGGALAVLATATAFAGIGVATPDIGLAAGVAAAVVACWLLAFLLDQGPLQPGDRRLGDVARVALLVPVGASFLLAPQEALPAPSAPSSSTRSTRCASTGPRSPWGRQSAPRQSSPTLPWPTASISVTPAWRCASGRWCGRGWGLSSTAAGASPSWSAPPPDWPSASGRRWWPATPAPSAPPCW
jgi:hypothetical protein